MTKKSKIEIIKALKNTKTYPYYGDISKQFHVTIREIKKIYKSLREKGLKIPVRPATSPKTKTKHIPIYSENKAKYKEGWTEQDCVNELRRLVYEYPKRVISRNFFRVNAQISEATWSRYFGTFAEFKRQADIVPTRQQHKLERDIAKQVSVDHYRKLGLEREGWAENYLKEKSGRFKTIVAGSDLHDQECDSFWLEVFIDTCRRIQPDVISLVGDVFDLPEFGKYTVDPRQWDVIGRIKFVHNEILKPLREVCIDTQIDLIEGNHESVELMTQINCINGWKNACDITLEDKIASYTLDGQHISYDRPIAIKHTKNQSMVSLRGDLHDELLYEKHRVDLDGKLVHVDTLLGGGKIAQHRFRYAINANNIGLVIDSNYLRYIMWVVMDGTILRRKLKDESGYQNNCRIQFKLSKQRKIDRLRKLLDSMGVEYTFRKATRSPTNKLQPYYICIYGVYALKTWKYLGGIKQIPKDWATLNRNQLNVALEELRNTDGAIKLSPNGSMRWPTTSANDRDVLQLACTTNDIAFSYTAFENRSGFKKNCKEQYVCRIYIGGYKESSRSVQVKRETKKADIVSIQSRYGTLVTRRNGKVSFTGNCRLLKHLADATPTLQAVLSDLHGMTVSKLLGLDEFEINYIAKADLAAYTISDIKKELARNYKVYYDCFMAHHFAEGRNFGLPGVSGHHHKQIMWALYNETMGSYNWLQMGAGHVRNATYCNGQLWQNGFAIIHIDTLLKQVNIEPILVSDFACVGGKYYYRNEQAKEE